MVNEMKSMCRKFQVLGICLVLLYGCQESSTKDTDTLLNKVLASDELAIKTVMQQPENYELQIHLILPNDTSLYQKNQQPIHRTNSIQTIATPKTDVIDYSQGQYFYPASTVKLPVAVLAAEWAELNPDLSIITPYRIANDTVTHHIAQDLIEIFAVSDNDAYNRLYDLLGRDYINQRMAELGISDFRLAHRLSVSNAADPEHPTYYFETDQGIKIFQAAADRPLDSLLGAGLQKGVGYWQEEHLVALPMDFSLKNYFPLASMMQFMQTLYPLDCTDCPAKFKWSKNTQDFVKMLMSSVPRKQGYDESKYPDGYVKFFFLGDSNERIGSGLKIHNKVGLAYGTLTDLAYIVDTKNDLHYLLGATLLVNENGIFNDNTYEYDSIGFPFLAQFSRRLHDLLLEAISRR